MRSARSRTLAAARVGNISSDRCSVSRWPPCTAGANDLRAIYRWGRRLKPEALPLFDITNGKAPCHATCHYFFQALDADALARVLGRYALGGAIRREQFPRIDRLAKLASPARPGAPFATPPHSSLSACLI